MRHNARVPFLLAIAALLVDCGPLSGRATAQTGLPVTGNLPGLPPGLVYGDSIVIQDDVVSADPITVVARSLRFESATSIRAPTIMIVAGNIFGQDVTLDASGADALVPGAKGDPGGTITVTARTAPRLVLDVSGGIGAPGRQGDRGSDGRRARCGTCCERGNNPAGPGGRGGNGGAGGTGGSGGLIRIAILRAASPAATLTDGGTGGAGGLAGRGGTGGGGCSACIPLPGQINLFNICNADLDGKSGAADGPAGIPGAPGSPGDPGSVQTLDFLFEPGELENMIAARLERALFGIW